MAITASDVKKLREKTGAGMLDCQKALKEANGDLGEAETILKKMGLAAVAKRSERGAEEGRIFTYVGSKKAGIMELACETDFVARNADFASTGDAIVKKAVEENLDASSPVIQELVTNIAATIKENISLRRLEFIELTETDIVESYLHGDAASTGVLVKFSLGDKTLASNDTVKTLIHDCALHAAAFKPVFLKDESVPAAYLAKQKEIFEGMVAQDEKLKDKPEQVRQGVISGKLQKLLKEVCFADQAFVKDDKKSVKQVLLDTGKSLGTSIELSDYRVFRAGESLED